MSRVLRKIFRVELDAERLDDVRRQDDEEQQVGQTGAALVGDELFLCQKNADGQKKHHLRLQVQHGGKFGHGIPFHLDVLCLAEPIIIA